MVDENESMRGTECVASINSPVRICHPMPASPNSFCGSLPVESPITSRTKIRSLTEGRRKRLHAFTAGVSPEVFKGEWTVFKRSCYSMWGRSAVAQKPTSSLEDTPLANIFTVETAEQHRRARRANYGSSAENLRRPLRLSLASVEAHQNCQYDSP